MLLYPPLAPRFTGLSDIYNYPGLGTTHQINITAEAYRNYTAGTIDGALINTVMSDNSSFMSHNAATITNRLGMSGEAAFHLTPGIEIDSSADLTLASSWDLHSYDTAYNGGVAGVLTLRAAGDLNLNSSLSDGFSNASDSAFQTNAPISTWSYRLVGGADLASPDALAVTPGTGNVAIAGNQLVRTGNGRIDVAAGSDITFGNQKSVLYTAGTKAAALAKPITVPSSANYATAGGDISLSAQNDVVGAPTTQLIADWLYRQGRAYSLVGPPPTATSWWLSFMTFQQNVGALGGGNITVNAGNNITDLSAVIPTTGRLPISGGVPLVSDFSVLGGGNLNVTAGGDIASGIFYLGRGTGQINAGGGLTKSSSSTKNTVLALDDAIFNIRARGDATLETAFNPMGLPHPNAQNVSSFTQRSFFFDYAPDSAIDVQSLTGDITFGNDIYAIRNSTQLDFSKGSSIDVLSLYPGSLAATAYQGSIVSNGSIQLYPAPLGNLQLLAGGNISAGSILLSDLDPGGLPNPLAPVTSIESTTTLLARGTGPSAHSLVPVHDQPGNPDSQPALIMADGDISGAYYIPKSAQLFAGNDILAMFLAAQNLRGSDITSVIAGHDISYPFTYNDQGALAADYRGIQVGGPGNLLVQAGGTIDLGTSSGITTTGNLSNPNLPVQGANVTVTAGISPTPDYSAFLTKVLDPASLPPASDPNYAAAYKYVSEVTDYMTAYENVPAGTLSDAQAYADFKALPAADQLDFLRPLTAEVFIDTYLDPAGPTTTYSIPGGTQTQTGGKYYGTDPSGNGKYLTDYMTAYNNVAPGTLSDAQALVAFRALSPLVQQEFMLQVFYQELRLTGRAHISDGFDYQRGFDAISSLFPAGNYSGDLNLYFSQIRTESGGNIDLLVPGGQVNAGLANPPASLGKAKGPENLGIVAQGTGDVSAFVDGDFLVNQSRVFTLLGGDILLWSSQGNIDAGRGAKTAITVPPPTVSTDGDGNTVLTYHGAALGSGIRVILTNPQITPGDVDLIAPHGDVNAGDAGIGAAGNLNIAAQRVVGADNIQVGGVATGTPVADTTAVSAGISGASNLGGDASKLASDVSRNLGEGPDNGALAYLSVDVLGFGDCKSGDESCSQ